MKPDGRRPKGRNLATSPRNPLSSSPAVHPEGQAAQAAAILKLLGDEDDSMVKLVLRQLLADQTTARPRIEGLLLQASGPAAGQLRTALSELRRRDAFAAIRPHCGPIETLAELENFCWHLALCHDPEAPVAAGRRQLDLWAEAVRDEVAPGASELEKLESLRLILADEAGLRGETENYYSPDNSFLDRVIASRRGIPISLTAIYMLVGGRAGIAVEPVGMPGHFLARVGSRYLDPFHEGLIVDRQALLELVDRTGEPEAEAALRGPLPLRAMAQRMVLNLVNIYEQTSDESEAAPWRQLLAWLRESV